MRSIRHGEDLLARDGSRLGQVDRIVVDEAARRVTHVVVDARAVPIGHVRDAGPDGLASDLDRRQLQELPDADEPPFAAPGENWEPPEGYRLEHFLTLVGDFARAVGPGPFRPPVHIETGASEIHEITAHSPVWCGDHQVGHVEGLTWDDEARVYGVVVRPGLLGHLREVPVDRVREVVANNVHLDMTPQEFDHIPPYDPLTEG